MKANKFVHVLVILCGVCMSTCVGAYERFVPLEGPVNFRDVGGYLTNSHTSIKRGLVYRSDKLDTLTDNDIVYLNNMGLKRVLDIRGEAEVADAPDKLDPKWAYESYPLIPDAGSLDTLPYTTICGQKPDGFTVYYCAMIDQFPERIGEILTKIMDSEKPIVFHCSAGQDRTGVTAALILLLLGVPEETVITDYTLSPKFGPTKYYRMDQTICHIKNKYGSVENYVYTTCNVNPDTVSRFKAELLSESTLVNLSSFTATPRVLKTILKWTTDSEIDNAGFNIYRADFKGGPFTQINTELIPAQGSPMQGTSYEYQDAGLQNRKTYFYELEDIDLNGNSTMHGPVSATPRLLYGLFQ